MPRNKNLIPHLTLIAGAIIIACQIFSPTEIPPTSTPQITKSTQASVLDACPITDQAAAMGPAEQPDWGTLSLNACYSLTLDLNPDEGIYTGGARLTFTNPTGQDLRDIVFRTYPNSENIYGGQLSITAAQVDGISVKPTGYRSLPTAFRLLLPTPLGPGMTTVINLEFIGRTPTDYGDLPSVYGIFNQLTDPQMIVLANWYPLLAFWQDGNWQAELVLTGGDAVVSEVALYNVEISIPKKWQLVTTGTEIERLDAGDRTTRTFVSGPVREFTILASPAFTKKVQQLDGILIHHWGLPSGEERWGEALDVTLDALQTYNDLFGPYPYAELDVVAVPVRLASGVEYPGLIMIDDALYGENTNNPYLLSAIVAHEVAHQWWYGVVGNHVLQQPWQDEALTTFSQLLYLEEHQPDWYAGTLQAYVTRVEAIEERGGETSIGQPVEAFKNRPEDYGPVVYTKGALFFHALWERLGDAVFFDALQSYYNHNRYKLAQPDDLLSAFEASCDCDLDSLYQQWGVIE